MTSNQNTTDNLKEKVNRKENFIPTENTSYLYPNGHRITHQMRWFKGSRDGGVRSENAA